jgi:hypothetical protein
MYPDSPTKEIIKKIPTKFIDSMRESGKSIEYRFVIPYSMSDTVVTSINNYFLDKNVDLAIDDENRIQHEYNPDNRTPYSDLILVTLTQAQIRKLKIRDIFLD